MYEEYLNVDKLKAAQKRLRTAVYSLKSEIEAKRDRKGNGYNDSYGEEEYAKDRYKLYHAALSNSYQDSILDNRILLEETTQDFIDNGQKNRKQYESKKAKYQDRIKDFELAESIVKKIAGNPFVMGTIDSMIRDASQIYELDHFIRNIQENEKFKKNPDLMSLLEKVQKVFSTYFKLEMGIEYQVDENFEKLKSFYEKKSFKDKLVGGKKEDEVKEPIQDSIYYGRLNSVDLFEQSVNGIKSVNRSKLSSIKSKAVENGSKKAGKLKATKILEETITNLNPQTEVKASDLSNCFKEVEEQEIIEELETMLTSISVNLPDEKSYSGTVVSFAPVHEEIKKAQEILNAQKKKNIGILTGKNYYSNIEKIQHFEYKTKVVASISRLYQKLSGEPAGSYIKKIEEEIANILDPCNLTQEEKNEIRKEAMEKAEREVENKRLEEERKTEEKREKAKREEAIAHHEGVTASEHHRNYEEAARSNNSKFKSDYVLHHGEVRDLNEEKRREGTIRDTAVSDEKLASQKYDAKVDAAKQLSSDREGLERMAFENGLNAAVIGQEAVDRYMQRAALQLSLEDKVKTSDLRILNENASEYKKVVEKAVALKRRDDMYALEDFISANKIRRDEIIAKINQMANDNQMQRKSQNELSYEELSAVVSSIMQDREPKQKSR